MSRVFRGLFLFTTLWLGLFGAGRDAAFAADKKVFKVGYVVYVGFMPMAWMKQSGVLKKWADKYGIEIDMVQANDYVGSINQFIAGDLDAVGVAGMDALTMPSAGGVDTSLFLITDYSNGNDVLMSKSAKSVADLAGQSVYLLQFSVSHYLLDRALVLNGLKGVSSVKTINISDSDISSAYLTRPDIQHAVSWKPMTIDMLAGSKNSHVLFDSSKIPGEIMDSFIGKTSTMKEHPEFAKALLGAWYESMQVMNGGGDAAKQMNAVMASAMGTDEAGFKAQVDTTHFFPTPEAEYDFMTADKTKQTWDYVRHFCFDQGLFGQGASSVDSIGIGLADGSVLGDTGNVKLRVDPSIAKLVRDKQL
jgi:NitT/TauT family transport system substrate-binding protein